MAHPIVHVEFATKNPTATAEFLKQLFGWSVHTSPMPGGEYVMFDTHAGLGGGLPEADGQMYHPGEALVYVGTNDIPGTLAKVEALGGSVVMPEMEIPGNGWFAIFMDASGARFALYKGM